MADEIGRVVTLIDGQRLAVVPLGDWTMPGFGTLLSVGQAIEVRDPDTDEVLGLVWREDGRGRVSERYERFYVVEKVLSVGLRLPIVVGARVRMAAG